MADFITLDGLKAVTSILVNATTTGLNIPFYAGWGTGTSGAGSSQTALGALTAPTTTKTAGTRSQVTTTSSGDTYRVAITVTSTGSFAITEFGLFDSPTTTGNNFMYARSDFAAVNVVSGDSIAFTHNTVCST